MKLRVKTLARGSGPAGVTPVGTFLELDAEAARQGVIDGWCEYGLGEVGATASKPREGGEDANED